MEVRINQRQNPAGDLLRGAQLSDDGVEDLDQSAVGASSQNQRRGEGASGCGRGRGGGAVVEFGVGVQPVDESSAQFADTGPFKEVPVVAGRQLTDFVDLGRCRDQRWVEHVDLDRDGFGGRHLVDGQCAGDFVEGDGHRCRGDMAANLFVVVRPPRQAAQPEYQLELFTVVCRCELDSEQFLVDVTDGGVAALLRGPRLPAIQPLLECASDLGDLGEFDGRAFGRSGVSTSGEWIASRRPGSSWASWMSPTSQGSNS